MMLKQTRALVWPSGDCKPLLQLGTSLVDLGRRYALRFERFDDELGPLQAAAAELGALGPVLLSKYDAGPNQSITLFVDRGVETNFAIQAAIDLLELDPDEIVWRQREI